VFDPCLGVLAVVPGPEGPIRAGCLSAVPSPRGDGPDAHAVFSESVYRLSAAGYLTCPCMGYAAVAAASTAGMSTRMPGPIVLAIVRLRR